GVLLVTTSNGMPIGPPFQRPEPKSAWRPVPAPIDWISCAEFAATGSASTRWFHALSDGKTGHRGAAGTRSADADAAPRSSAPAARASTRVIASSVPETPDAGIPLPGAPRERDRDRGSLAFAALEGDRPAVLLDERAGDREAEARARDGAAGGGRRAEEPREDLRLLVGRDADAVVADDDTSTLAVALDADRHRAAGVGELHRVRDEVVEHLGDPRPVGAHRRRRVDRDLDADAPVGGGRPRRLGRALGDVAEVDRSEGELDAPRLDLRDEQQILDERVQAVGAAPDDVEVPLPGVAERVLLVEQHLEEARDRRERRPQLVRDRGDERVAHAVELAVRRHLAKRPDAPPEAGLGFGHGRRVAAEDAPGAGDLELVGRRLTRRARDLEHAPPVPLGLRDRVRDREQAVRHGPLEGHTQLGDETAQRLVRDED